MSGLGVKLSFVLSADASPKTINIQFQFFRVPIPNVAVRTKCSAGGSS